MPEAFLTPVAPCHSDSSTQPSHWIKQVLIPQRDELNALVTRSKCSYVFFETWPSIAACQSFVPQRSANVLRSILCFVTLLRASVRTGDTQRVSHIRQGWWTSTPSLTTIWQSMKDFGTDKCRCQLNGKHRVSAIILWMGEVKNNSQRKMQREAECRCPHHGLLREAPGLLRASPSCAHPSPPGGDPQTWAITIETSLQIQPGCGTTERCRRRHWARCPLHTSWLFWFLHTVWTS